MRPNDQDSDYHPEREHAPRETLAVVLAGALIWLVASMLLAHADPLPAPRAPTGEPPHGYVSSGSFYAPRAGAQEAIPKPANGSCPWGWTSSANYCLRSGGR